MIHLSSLRRPWFLRVVSIGTVVVLPACGSSGTSTTASAAASTSSTPAAKASATATAKEAAAPVGPKLKVKLDADGFEGDYESSRALFSKRSGGTMLVRLEKDCPQFSCSAFFDDTMLKACPKGTSSEVAEIPNKVGKYHVDVTWHNQASSYVTRGVDVEITQTTDTEIRGTLTKNAEGDTISGSFVGSYCPSPE